jgi:hypothetical protein
MTSGTSSQGSTTIDVEYRPTHDFVKQTRLVLVRLVVRRVEIK